MTVPGWDPEKWHAQHGQQNAAASTATRTRNVSPKRVAVAAAVLLLAGAAAVSATHVADDGGGPVGVCHATASEQNPYVFIVVDKDGYEHGHHRHHDGDFFVDASQGDCEGDPPVDETEGHGDSNETTDGGNGTEEPTTGNETTDGGNGTDEPAEGNGTEAPTDGNETTDEGNETEEPTDGNETAAGGNETAAGGNETDAPTDGNETAEGNATGAGDSAEQSAEEETPPAPGNAQVFQEAAQDDFEVVLSITVQNGGEGVSHNVTLADELPDLRRSWHLGGEDSEHCVLDDRDLSCWFGSMEPGESATIELQAFTDRMPCGFPQNNTAFVSALDDADERDNASSAGIEARPC